MRKGIVSLLIVFLVAMVSILIITSWESRVLLSIHRNASLSDNLAATYNAESEINDVIARVLGEYPLPNSGTRTLSDGTIMTLAVTTSGNTDTINVHAKRQFASTSIQVSKTKTESDVTNLDKVEITLEADCTGSMDNKADPTCVGTCANRISKEKEAILNFIDGINALPTTEKDKYYLGILTFKIGKKWVNYNGEDMTPTNDMTKLSDAVQAGFGYNVAHSSACSFTNPSVPGSNGETSLGTPTVFTDDYFRPTKDSRKKQIQVLVTDGLPNSSLADPRCGTINCKSVEGGSCTTSALKYLECGVADTSTTWGGGLTGLRDPDVDTYAVTLLSSPSTPGEQAAYNGAVGIFQNSAYVKKYYNSENAENLSDFLADIFDNIQSTVTSFEIRHLVPTPVR